MPFSYMKKSYFISLHKGSPCIVVDPKKNYCLIGFSLLSYTKTTRPKEAKTFQKISMAQKYFEFGEKSKKIFLPIIKIKLPCWFQLKAKRRFLKTRIVCYGPNYKNLSLTASITPLSKVKLFWVVPVRRSQMPMQFLVTTTAIPASVDTLTESIGNSCLSMWCDFSNM